VPAATCVKSCYNTRIFMSFISWRRKPQGRGCKPWGEDCQRHHKYTQENLDDFDKVQHIFGCKFSVAEMSTRHNGQAAPCHLDTWIEEISMLDPFRSHSPKSLIFNVLVSTSIQCTEPHSNAILIARGPLSLPLLRCAPIFSRSFLTVLSS